MKFKSIAVIAVLAMFLASSVCVPLAAYDGNGEGLRDTDASPLVINTSTASFESEEYNASYDKDTATLTFNGGVSVNCTCTKTENYIIKATIDHLTIVVNGDTVLKSTTPVEGDTGAIEVNPATAKTSSSVLIKGDGKLTLIPNYSSTTGKTSTGINCTVVNIVNTKLVIDGSQVGQHYFRGVRAWDGYISVLNSNLKIKGSGGNVDGYVNQGLYNNWVITIQGSTVEMDNLISGIWQEESFAHHVMTGTCTIASSKVTINTIKVDGYDTRSMPINTGTLTITDSTVDAIADDATGWSKDHPANSVAVNTLYFNATNSIMNFKGAKGWSSSGLEFASEATVTNCTLTCTSDHGAGATSTALAQSGIKTNLNGVLTTYGSVIVSKDLDTAAEKSYGIIANCKFVQSSVTAEGNKAFYDKCTVKFEMDTISSLEGSNDGTSYSAITNDQVFDYKYVRSVMGCTASFDLNGGTGTKVDPISKIAPDTEITLPTCDAKKGDKVFVGWNDGKKIYNAGEKYKITADTVFYAVYKDEKFTVSFDLNGGTGTPVSPISDLSAGQIITFPTCNAKKGDKIFAGWSDGLGIYLPGQQYTVTENTIFYAVYADPTINVFFDLNGGTGTEIPPMTDVKRGTTITLPACDAKKGNLTFVGWNDGKNIYQPGQKYVVNENTVFYAMYGDFSIVISFDLNGGKGTAIPPIVDAEKGTEITLPNCDAKKGNLTFVGWNDGKNIYKPGQKYVVTESMVFYAMYKDTSITVYFDLNGGKGTAIDPMKNVAKGTTIRLPACDAKNGTQEFAGWNDGKKIYKAGEEYVVDGTIELHAMYEDVQTPTSNDNTGLTISIIVIVVVAILAVVGLAWYKKN